MTAVERCMDIWKYDDELIECVSVTLLCISQHEAYAKGVCVSDLGAVLFSVFFYTNSVEVRENVVSVLLHYVASGYASMKVKFSIPFAYNIRIYLVYK